MSRLVIDTLEPLPQDRKCFRMINGVLVERTVKDVIPSLKTNADGLKQVLDDLLKQYKSKQDEMEDWKVPNPGFPSFAFSSLRCYRKSSLGQRSHRGDDGSIWGFSRFFRFSVLRCVLRVLTS
jgi:hypothetical protein